jgi:ArsR family transcriptional regulator, arsenate/arsenite/antimonite-responsive transcriptional repressor / arsenate reductase (thioredoxin)
MENSHLPQAFAALAHEVRLDCFRLLIHAGRSGMSAGDLGTALAVRQNTMSTNLAVLEKAGLIRSQREGRVIRYFAHMPGLRFMLDYLLRDCCGGETSDCDPLLESLTEPGQGFDPSPEQPLKVLFLCDSDATRPLIAEALLRRAAPGRFAGHSAGQAPGCCLSAAARSVLDAQGVNSHMLQPSARSRFAGPDAPKMDLVIDLSEVPHTAPPPVTVTVPLPGAMPGMMMQARVPDTTPAMMPATTPAMMPATVPDTTQATKPATVPARVPGTVLAPAFPGTPIAARWPMPDPTRASDPDAALARAFKLLQRRISVLTNLPTDRLDRQDFQNRLNDIGTPT